MNGQGRSGKFYMIHAILTSLVNEHGVDKDCYLKLPMTGKVACLIRGYNVHSHQFGIGILKGNTKLNN